MYHVIWEYEVRVDQVSAFERLYDSAGAWSQLFGTAQGYVGTELYRDTARPTHFITVDRWVSPEAFAAALPTLRESYDRLDQQAAALTLREQRLGAFEA